jgi:hypothetical protein
VPSPAFLLSRSGPPLPAAGAGSAGYDWNWAIAWPFAALASPRSGERMPALPDLGDPQPQSASLGYWNSLSYLLSYSLGWSRHDRGLRWWYDAGKPTDDPRFALINEVWERDGTLELYLEWAHERLNHSPFDYMELPLHHELPPQPDMVSPAWKDRLRDIRRRNSFGPGSLRGQPNGFHLEMGSHITHALGSPKEPVAVLFDPTDFNRGVLVLPDLDRWYGTLRSVGSDLIELNGPSQRVRVHIESAGYLGEFRLSRETALWFAGPHRYHSVGN